MKPAVDAPLLRVMERGVLLVRTANVLKVPRLIVVVAASLLCIWLLGSEGTTLFFSPHHDQARERESEAGKGDKVSSQRSQRRQRRPPPAGSAAPAKGQK